MTSKLSSATLRALLTVDVELFEVTGGAAVGLPPPNLIRVGGRLDNGSLGILKSHLLFTAGRTGWSIGFITEDDGDEYELQSIVTEMSAISSPLTRRFGDDTVLDVE